MNVSIRSKYRSRFQNSETKAESRGSEGILRRSRIVKIHGGSEGEALTRPIREAVLGPRESLGLESHWPEDRECILRQVQRCKRASYEWSELCPRLPLLRRLRYCCGSFLSLPSPSPFSRAPDLPELRFVQFFLLPPMGGGVGRGGGGGHPCLSHLWEILAFQARRHKQHNACNATFRTRVRPCTQGRRSCSMTFLCQRMIVRGRFVGEASFTSGATSRELLEFERLALAHVSDKFEQLIRSRICLINNID